METAVTEKRPLSNRQRAILRRKIKAEQAAAPKADRPAPEVYEPAVAKHADDRVIPGLSGRGAILRADNLKKLWEAGKITPIQYSAGQDYVEIVESYFVTASGMGRMDETAGRVGGDGDPIRRYNKARPARKQQDGTVIGYIPTQRPRHPGATRASSDGWTHDKFRAMGGFQQMEKAMGWMTKDQRNALCVLVIDPSRPFLPPLTVNMAVRRMFGSENARRHAILIRWLGEALDILEPEIHAARRAMAA